MNTLKNINHARTLRRRKAKLAIKRANSRKRPRLEESPNPKPPQPTIIKLSTAKRLRYLEERFLVKPFNTSDLMIEHTHYHDKVLNKLIRMPDGTQSVGV